MVAKSQERLSKLVKVDLTLPENFFKIKHFLKRVGINPRNTNRVFQTCHILKNGNDFYICHFKELFWLDGKQNGMDDLDRERRNKIISLLVEKNLIKSDVSGLSYSKAAANSVFIVPYLELDRYTLHTKYRFKTPKSEKQQYATV